MDKKHQIAQTILEELNQFNSFSAGKRLVQTTNSFTEKKFEDGRYNAVKDIFMGEINISKEPFIAYVKVLEQEENQKEWREHIYLFCRGYSPFPIVKPFNPLTMYANRNQPLGAIASADIDEEIEIKLPQNRAGTKYRSKRFIVKEKNIFTPYKEDNWDAIKNSISFENISDFIPSLREIIAERKISRADGAILIKEIDKAEQEIIEQRRLQQLKKQKRNKAIVSSIALKDQPILDKFQDRFCRLPLASQILLTGSPGTGKTTTLIKRLAYKSDSQHLLENDEIELESSQIKKWLIFTPNDLLKIYLKEALNKEGLSATDQTVTTWDKERTVLGREILKILKTANGGIFNRTREEVLKDNTSVGTAKYANDFIRILHHSIFNDFSEAVSFLEELKPNSEIISKEYNQTAQNFQNFIDGCKRVKQNFDRRNTADFEFKTILLINEFQPLKSQLTQLRSEINALIKQTLDELIITHPDVIQKVSDIISEIEAQPENNVTPENDTDEDDLSEADDEILADDELDAKVEARRQIRQAFVKYAESLSSKKPLRNKRQLKIWGIIAPFLINENLLNFIGRLNISLRRKIFGHLEYSRIIEQIPIRYDKYRLSLIKEKELSLFKESSVENIKNKKISFSEIDVLIYIMLRFTAKIFQEKRDFLRSTSNNDLLENIKTHYRTQIAVDEAADFSSVQLGCMFHLAHPQYKSVSFAGDLMQRVTQIGVRDWNECDFISENFQNFELAISYRQTPILLQIAGKLYENIIGQKPPFRSKNTANNEDPHPLKFKAENDEILGDWIAQRISEIYKITGSLPSIAIFVPEEGDIEPIYKIIQEKLDEISIDVEMCREGKVLGTGSRIRIFSVEYIKGLEFEGVFFVGIDEIQSKKPDLLDKYLYVGLTRATTFLGVTYKTKFPEKLAIVEADFNSGDWSEFT